MAQERTINNQNIHDEAMWEKAHSAEIPEAYFRCAGMDFNSHLLMDIHFQDDSPGYLSPAELYYGELVEPDAELAVCGFFCPEHLKALGQIPQGPNLAQVLRRRALTAFQDLAGIPVGRDEEDTPHQAPPSG